MQSEEEWSKQTGGDEQIRPFGQQPEPVNLKLQVVV